MKITGYFVYGDLTIMQHTSVKEKFIKLITSIKPTKILEIGTSSGGLTLMLRDILDTNGLESTRLISYDINDPVYLRCHVDNGRNIELKVENVFNHQYDKLENEEVNRKKESDTIKLKVEQNGSLMDEYKKRIFDLE